MFPFNIIKEFSSIWGSSQKLTLVMAWELSVWLSEVVVLGPKYMNSPLLSNISLFLWKDNLLKYFSLCNIKKSNACISPVSLTFAYGHDVLPGSLISYPFFLRGSHGITSFKKSSSNARLGSVPFLGFHSILCIPQLWQLHHYTKIIGFCIFP